MEFSQKDKDKIWVDYMVTQMGIKHKINESALVFLFKEIEEIFRKRRVPLGSRFLLMMLVVLFEKVVNEIVRETPGDIPVNKIDKDHLCNGFLGGHLVAKA
mgnify:CR=1 FL=1